MDVEQKEKIIKIIEKMHTNSISYDSVFIELMLVLDYYPFVNIYSYIKVTVNNKNVIESITFDKNLALLKLKHLDSEAVCNGDFKEKLLNFLENYKK